MRCLAGYLARKVYGIVCAQLGDPVELAVAGARSRIACQAGRRVGDASAGRAPRAIAVR